MEKSFVLQYHPRLAFQSNENVTYNLIDPVIIKSAKKNLTTRDKRNIMKPIVDDLLTSVSELRQDKFEIFLNYFKKL